MIRRLFASASALSLVLCVATVALWVRSYWIGDEVKRGTAVGEVRCESLRGLVCFEWGRRYMGVSRVTRWHYEAVPNPASYDWPYPSGLEGSLWGDSLGVLWGGAGGVDWRVVVFPDWLLCLLLVMLPARSYIARCLRWLRLRRHHNMGFCAKCGYDLRASKDRCPECGTPIPSEVEATAAQKSRGMHA